MFREWRCMFLISLLGFSMLSASSLSSSYETGLHTETPSLSGSSNTLFTHFLSFLKSIQNIVPYVGQCEWIIVTLFFSPFQISFHSFFYSLFFLLIYLIWIFSKPSHFYSFFTKFSASFLVYFVVSFSSSDVISILLVIHIDSFPSTIIIPLIF